MKIAIDARLFKKEKGGIARYTQELISHLLKMQTDDTFHLIMKKEEVTTCYKDDPRVHIYPVDIAHYSLKEQILLPRVLKAIKPDVVHFTHFSQPILYKSPSLTTVHDLMLKTMPLNSYQRSILRQKALDVVMKKALKSNKVIVPSFSVAQDIKETFNLDGKNIHVTYEAASSHFYLRSEKEIESFRCLHDLRAPYFLFASQWRRHKGIFEILEAFEKLKATKRFPHKLVILGKPHPHFEDVAHRIISSSCKEDIVLPGFVTEELLPLYYNAAEIVLIPSYIEGFGLGLVEAMSSYTSIITTSTPTTLEIAADAAEIVKPQDSKSLYDAMFHLIQNESRRHELKEKGLQRAKLFSWKTMAEATYELYGQVNKERHEV